MGSWVPPLSLALRQPISVATSRYQRHALLRKAWGQVWIRRGIIASSAGGEPRACSWPLLHSFWPLPGGARPAPPSGGPGRGWYPVSPPSHCWRWPSAAETVPAATAATAATARQRQQQQQQQRRQLDFHEPGCELYAVGQRAVECARGNGIDNCGCDDGHAQTNRRNDGDHTIAAKLFSVSGLYKKRGIAGLYEGDMVGRAEY